MGFWRQIPKCGSAVPFGLFSKRVIAQVEKDDAQNSFRPRGNGCSCQGRVGGRGPLSKVGRAGDTPRQAGGSDRFAFEEQVQPGETLTLQPHVPRHRASPPWPASHPPASPSEPHICSQRPMEQRPRPIPQACQQDWWGSILPALRGTTQPPGQADKGSSPAPTAETAPRGGPHPTDLPSTLKVCN